MLDKSVFDEIEIAGHSIGDRLAFNNEFKRADISDFAVAARDIVTGNRLIDANILMEANRLLAQIQQQIGVEGRLPAGVRIGTFAHSPIFVILALHKGQPSPVPTSAMTILTWLRLKTGWDESVDRLTERAIGISLPVLAQELAKLHWRDPIAFYLLISFEFDHSSLDMPIAYPVCRRQHRERQWPFHIKMTLNDVMRMIAEWCRAISIANNLFEREAVHHLALRNYIERATTGSEHSSHLRAIMDAMPLPVPMLKAALNPMEPFSARNMMAEFERIVMPSAQHGNGTKRPLYHFYGLDAVEVLMVAFLDILCVSRGVPAPSSALNGPYLRRPHFEHFGQDRLTDVIQATIANRWPNRGTSIKLDAALRAKILRRRYARASVVAGSAYRFDPEFWSRPERDARLFERMAQMPNTNPTTVNFPNRVAQIRDTLLSGLGIRIDADHIKFGSRVVAQLMSATTVLTRDPVFLALLDHAMWQSGYRSNRNVCHRQACRKQGKCLCDHKVSWVPYRDKPIYAARNWGCVLPVGAIGSRKFPELPRKG